MKRSRPTQERLLGDSLVQIVQTAELAAFQTGEIQLGPLPVIYLMGPDTLALWTEALTIPVASVIGDSQQVADLRDIKPPLPLKKSRLLWYLAGLALLLLIIAAIILVRRRKKELGIYSRPLPPPLDEFKQGLVQLEADRFPEQGEWGLYTLRLSWLVRRYMERRFRAPILEMTTSEIRRWSRGETLDMKLGSRLIQWLGIGDQIKFAGVVPTLAECGRMLEEGREIVFRIEETLPGDEEPAGEERED